MFTIGELKQWIESCGLSDDTQIMSHCSREDKIYEGDKPIVLELVYSHQEYGLNHYDEVDKESIGSIKGVLI